MNAQHFDNLKCIWMSSGIVDYKLCELDFDCERCEFDRVMRNRSAQLTEQKIVKTSVFESLMENAQTEKYADNIHILKNNFILRRVFQNSYMISFSFFLWRMLDPLDQTRCTLGKGFIRKNEQLAELRGGWGSITIPAPFDLHILSAFVGKGTKLQFGSWLGLIEADEHDILAAGILLSEKREHALDLLRTLGHDLQPAQFATMQDGGETVKYLYQVTGKAKFRQILAEIFSI